MSAGIILQAILNMESKNAAKGLKNTKKEVKATKSEIVLMYNMLAQIPKKLLKATDSSDQYNASLRLLKTTLGETTGEATKFINKLSEMSGIDETSIIRQTAKFVQLGESLNMSNQQAEKFSENLSVLATKLSLLYNVDYSKMGSTLQKAMQGKPTTLTSMTGISLKESAEQATLMAYGINREVKSLNDAELALVKYATILRQVTSDNKVYENAVNSLAWQKQMLTAQSKRLATAIGQLLTPVLTKLYIVLNAVLMVATEIVKTIATLVGINLNFDSSVDSMSESYEDLGDSITSASNAAKKSLRGFDKLNNITTPTSGSSGGALGIDKSLLKLLNETDENFLNIKNKATEIRDIILNWFGLGENKDLDKFKSKLELITKIFEGILTLVIAIKNKLKLINGVGLFLIIDGIKNLVEGIIKLVENPSIQKFGNVLGSIGEIATGASLLVGILTPLGQILAVIGGVALIIGGIVEYIGAIIDFIKNPSWENFTDILRGILKSTGLIGYAVDWLVENVLGGWNNITNAIQGFGEMIYNNIILPIQEFFTPIVEWISTNILTPIQKFFEETWQGIVESLQPLITEIQGAFEEAWKLLQTIWNDLQPYFEKAWNDVVEIFQWAWEFVQNIWNGVQPYFEQIWNIIKNIFSVVKTVIGGYFSTAWEFIKAAWNNAVNFFTAIWAGIKAVFSVVRAVLTGDFTEAWENIKNVWDKVKKYFEGVWNGIKNVFGSVASWFQNVFATAWQAVKNVFSSGGKIFEGIKEGIGNTLKVVVNGIISGINTVISNPFNRINSILRTLKQIEILGLKPFNWISTISVPQIPKLYAEGGFPKEGEFFVAREKGAEMVGSINGHTAVANNDQIVEGIQSGVFNAVMSALNNTDFGGSSNVVIEATGDTQGLLNFIQFKQKQQDRQFN